jgi:hypothetical protein
MFWKNEINPATKFDIIVILLSFLTIGLLYSVNLFHLVYLLTPWQYFGETTITAVRILDFEPKTESLIGYKEPETGKAFTCQESVAFLEADDQKIYRCCNSPEKTSCVISSYQIRTTEECTRLALDIFNIQEHLPGTRDFKAFGYCRYVGTPSITVVQITNGGKILWKAVDIFELDFISIGLKLFSGPIIALAGWIVIRKRRHTH